jgi:hypothetical protein
MDAHDLSAIIHNVEGMHPRVHMAKTQYQGVIVNSIANKERLSR